MHTRCDQTGFVRLGLGLLLALGACGPLEETQEDQPLEPEEPRALLLSQHQASFGELVLDLRDPGLFAAATAAVVPDQVTLLGPAGQEARLDQVLEEMRRQTSLPLLEQGAALVFTTSAARLEGWGWEGCFARAELPCGEWSDWLRAGWFPEACAAWREVDGHLTRPLEEEYYGPRPEVPRAEKPPNPDPFAADGSPDPRGGDPLGGGSDDPASGGGSESTSTGESGGRDEGYASPGGAGGGFGGHPSGGRL